MPSCGGKKQGFMAIVHTRAATDGAKTTLDVSALGMETSKTEI